MRGIGDCLDSEQALRGYFGGYGFKQAVVRHREDEDGNNTSWALVTMESPEAAAAVIAAKPHKVSFQQVSEESGETVEVERELVPSLPPIPYAQQDTCRRRRSLFWSTAVHGKKDSLGSHV